MRYVAATARLRRRGAPARRAVAAAAALALAGCGPARTATDRAAPYAVEIVSPAAGAAVGSAGTAVVVTVTRAAADAPVPAGVALRDAYQTVLTLSRPAVAGLVATFAGTYLPPAGVEGAVDFRATVNEGTSDEATSAAVQVLVDTRPPVVTEVTARCDVPGCPRDAVVTLSAAIDEAHLALAEGWLELDPGEPVPVATARVALSLDAATGRYEGRVRLADAPFAAAERLAATPHVRAVDAGGNAVVDAAGPPRPLTRLRYAVDLGEPVTAAAVDGAGRILMGGSSGAALVFTPGAAGSYVVAKRPLGVPGLTAPLVGADGAWFTSSASPTAVLLAPDGSAKSWSCRLDDAKARGLSAATAPAGVPWVYAAGPVGKSQMVETLSARQAQCQAAAVKPELATPLLALHGALFAGTGGSSPGVAGFSIDPASGAAVDAGWRSTLAAGPYACDAVAAPLAVDAFGHLMVVCANGQLWCVDPESPELPIYLHTFDGAAGGVAGSPLGLASKDVVVAVNGTLRKYALLTWREVTFAPPTGKVTGYLATRADASGAVLYAVTDQGGLFALDAQLGVVWSASLGTAALGEPTLAPATSADGALPTLYVAGADGALYGVVVDAPLDDASPWPKGRHDAANTGQESP